MKLKLTTLALLICLLFSCVSSPAKSKRDTLNPTEALQILVKNSTSNSANLTKNFKAGSIDYEVHIHNPSFRPVLHDQYSKNELADLEKSLANTLEIRVDERGLAQAADRDSETKSGAEVDPTHYDAIWVRDNLWVALGLQTADADKARAKKIILTLSDYFSSPAQMERMGSAIKDPSRLSGPDGPMNAVHIRFDRKSTRFLDVQENGAAQKWNHKQNDALGLFLDLFCREILSGSITPKELTASRQRLLVLFPQYFEAIKYYEMEDAGSWEEIERVNTSSISLVVSGLERLAKVSARVKFKIDRVRVKTLINEGYNRIRNQLAEGGESPEYDTNDPRYRKSDVALLNLIYPARLERMKKPELENVLHLVRPLIGEIGIRRYLGDSYQSGNFWFISGSSTADSSSDQAFQERARKGIVGSEAQWFFDSWLSLAYGEMNVRFPSKSYREKQIQYFNRALGQITGGTSENPILGADGRSVPAFALPESYNTIVDPSTGARSYAPSPITPLNWAKATLRLAFRALRK